MKSFSKTLVFALSSLIFVVLSGVASCAAPVKELNVLVTIKPIHSLVASVLAGVASPKLLLDGASSPHAYALKPSDAAALANATVIVRVSPHLETFLSHALDTLGSKAHLITLQTDVPGLTLLDVREAGFEDLDEEAGHVHTPIHASPDEAQENASRHDVHFWLDPLNAIAIAEALAAQFSTLDPDHAQIFQSNADKLKIDLLKLDADLKVQFAPVREKPFIVFHDVAHYLEDRYGLKGIGAVTPSPEREPGAQRLVTLRSKIKTLGAVCVFAEPQFPPKLIMTLIEGTSARLGTLDEIGVEIPSGPDHYIKFMQANADRLVNCLRSQ